MNETTRFLGGSPAQVAPRGGREAQVFALNRAACPTFFCLVVEQLRFDGRTTLFIELTHDNGPAHGPE